MKPVAFPSYEQRHALAALALLSETAIFCKVTAGGQSLGPILNLACAAGCPDRHQPTDAVIVAHQVGRRRPSSSLNTHSGSWPPA